MQKPTKQKRVLGRVVARQLSQREVAMVSGAGGSYDKELVGCETCITCYGGKFDLQSET